MKKYVQRKVEIEAVQFLCNNIETAEMFIEQYHLEGFRAKYKKLPGRLHTELLLIIPPQGEIPEKIVRRGMWLTKSETGMYASSINDIFHAVFEESK